MVIKNLIVRNFFKGDKVICIKGRLCGVTAKIIGKVPDDTTDIAVLINIRLDDIKKYRKYMWSSYESDLRSAGNWRLINE